MNRNYDVYMCREKKQVFHSAARDWHKESSALKFDAELEMIRAENNWKKGLEMNRLFSLYK